MNFYVLIPVGWIFFFQTMYSVSILNWTVIQVVWLGKNRGSVMGFFLVNLKNKIKFPVLSI